jgi:hypothetical protein
MTHALLVCALLHSPPLAKPKPKTPAQRGRHQPAHADHRPLTLSHTIAAAPATFNLQSAFERAMSSVGLGVSSGKLVLKRPGRSEEIALAVPGARLTPLFDVSPSGASAHFRITF